MNHDTARIKFPAPFMAIASIFVGMGLQQWCTLRMDPLSDPFYGYFMMIFAIYIIAHSVYLFRKAQTDVLPWRPTSRIVTVGPYKYSRNPIYLACLIFDVGLAIVLNNAWIVVLQIIVVIAATHFVIKREEAYLERKFGQEYLSYKETRRRWV